MPQIFIGESLKKLEVNKCYQKIILVWQKWRKNAKFQKCDILDYFQTLWRMQFIHTFEFQLFTCNLHLVAIVWLQFWRLIGLEISKALAVAPNPDCLHIEWCRTSNQTVQSIAHRPAKYKRKKVKNCAQLFN